MKVHLMTDLMIDYLISDHCKIPDHSLLEVVILPSFIHDQVRNPDNVKSRIYKNDIDIPKRKVYDYRTMSNDIFSSEYWENSIIELIDNQLSIQLNQQEIDKTYNDLCELMFLQIDEHVNFKYVQSKKSRRKYKIHKPSWDAELSELWSNMNDKERSYLKYHGNSNKQKNRLRIDFKQARGIFDKRLRQKARQHNYVVISNLEEACNKNPT